MSVRIGEIGLRGCANGIRDATAHVSASRAGVEILTEESFTLDPIQARNYAALLVRAADEVERMRARPEPP